MRWLRGQPRWMRAAGLFAYAAVRARQDGLCFVHLDDEAPPSYVVMTFERYKALTDRIFGSEGIPVGDPEWLHDHASPEMLGEAKRWRFPNRSLD